MRWGNFLKQLLSPILMPFVLMSLDLPALIWNRQPLLLSFLLLKPQEMAATLL